MSGEAFPVAALTGVAFAKMTGSGNDFVFFDSRTAPMTVVTAPHVIQAICNRNNGIGADGVVVLEPSSDSASVRIHYFNSDGTPADLCGNATLCSTTLSVEMGLADIDSRVRLQTGAGEIRSQLHDGLPQITLQPVSVVRPAVEIPLGDGEDRIGFAIAPGR